MPNRKPPVHTPRCNYCGGRHEWQHTTRDAIRWGIRRNDLNAFSLAISALT